MPNISAELLIQNEKSEQFKIVLEPMSEYFLLEPNQRVVVHAIFDDNTKNINFTIAPNEDCLIIYAPGEISGFIDCFVMHEGKRLAPDGN